MNVRSDNCVVTVASDKHLALVDEGKRESEGPVTSQKAVIIKKFV
jgi:hypothetical protein